MEIETEQPGTRATALRLVLHRLRAGWWAPALGAVVALLLVPRVVLFVQLGVERVVWPWQIDFTEGINLNATLELAQWNNIYRHNGPEGFLSAPYTPLYNLLNLPFAWLSGPSLAGGRAISLLSTVGVALLLVYAVARAGKVVWPGIVAGVLWLSLGPTIVWSAFYKQDLTALLLEMAGLAAIISGSGARRLYLAALLFALAFYTKQSTLSGAAAAGLWLLIRDWQLSVRFGLALGAMVLVPFALGNLVLRGGLWEHLIEYHASFPHSERRRLRGINRLVGEHWPLLILCTLSIVAAIGSAFARTVGLVRQRISGPWGLAICYAVIGWVSTLARLGYEGAHHNHLIDGLLPSCFVVGLALAWLARSEQGRTPWVGPLARVRMFALPGAAGLLVAQAIIMTPPHTWHRSGWPSAENDLQMRSLSNLIARAPGDVYSEDVHLLLANGKRVLYDDASTFVPLARLGAWDSSHFTQAVRDRRFSLIVLHHGIVRWTEEGHAALDAHYKLESASVLDLYSPKVYPDLPQYMLNCLLSRGTESVTLLGYSLGPAVAQNGVSRGEVLHATLYWRVDEPLRADYATYLHVVNEAGEGVAGRDNPQSGALQPSHRWETGKVITDTTAVPLPASLTPGSYRLIAGMYRWAPTGLEGFAAQCDARLGSASLLGRVEVR